MWGMYFFIFVSCEPLILTDSNVAKNIRQEKAECICFFFDFNIISRSEFHTWKVQGYFSKNILPKKRF